MAQTGYTRQSAGSIITGATILASHFNNEYNQLNSAFDNTSGHRHDGSVTGGGASLVIASFTGLTNTSAGLLGADGANGFTTRTITGTSGTITVTNGTGVSGNPTLTIDAAYVGQSTITTLGTVTTGVWHGTLLGSTYGGTGVNNGSSTITIGGNVSLASTLTTAAAFTTAGAFGLTLTATALTNVTLPTTGTLATLAGSETLTNKTLTAPVISSITNTGTITLPTATGTLATLAGTETFTNKTITSPAITGGTLNNATVGATTPNTGAFTTLTSSAATTLVNSMFTFTTGGALTLGTGNWGVTSAGNISCAGTLSTGGGTFLVDASGNATAVTLKVTGSSAPTNGVYLPASNTVGIAAQSLLAMTVQGNSSAVNYINVQNAATGFAPIIQAVGSDSFVHLNIQSKGAGNIYLETSGGSFVQAEVVHTASSTQWPTLTGSNGGAPTISTSGGDLNLSSNSGHVTAPTETSTDNSTRVATTAFVKTAVGSSSPNFLNAKPSAPAANATGTPLMMGTGATVAFTPTGSGKVYIVYSGQGSNTSGGADQTTVTLYFGTGSAPVNGASVTGTSAGITQTCVSSNNNYLATFSLNHILTLTPATAYWFDLAVAAPGGATSSVANLSATIYELK